MENCENSLLFSLPAGKPRRLAGSGAQAIKCVLGVVWLSTEGVDVVLQAGKQYWARDCADVVIEALQKDASVKLTSLQVERESIPG